LHRLGAENVSLDSSVIVDFHLTNNLALLESLFAGRMLLSDFVEQEVAEAGIRLQGAEVISLANPEEWQFFEELQRNRPILGSGELGALTVASFKGAILLSNDKQARQAAEEAGIPVHGSMGVLEFGVDADAVSGREAVTILEDMIRQGAWVSDDLLELFRLRVLEGG